MTGARPADILRQLEETVSSDRDLLARFERERDQLAFRELVTRYGPLVLSVCRRVTGQREDAEDSFQAVFLILARKASSIRNAAVLGSWLHGVALRVAKTARRAAKRRRAREAAVSIMREQAATANDPVFELGPILDEELAALPSWYRDAIVLCDLRGVSREEAAAALAIPEGTLSSRLAAGRKKLAARLTRRGLALSAATITTTFSQGQTAVAAELLAKTCALATDWMAGGAIPRPLAKLTDGGMTVWKTLSIGLFATVAAVAGVVYAAQPAAPPAAVEPPVPATAGNPVTAEPPAPVIEPKRGQAYTTAPSLSRIVDLDLTRVHSPGMVRWNPQGTRLAVAGYRARRIQGDRPVGQPGFQPSFEYEKAIAVVENDSSLKFLDFKGNEAHNQLVGFTPDGKRVLTEVREYELVSGIHSLEYWTTPSGNNPFFFSIERTVKLSPVETQGYVFAPDGKTFRTLALERDPGRKEVRKLTVMEVDAATGKPLKSLLSLAASTFALSSDGKRLAAMDGQDSEDAVTVYDVDRALRLVSYRLPEIKTPEQFKVTVDTIKALSNAKVPPYAIKKLWASFNDERAYHEDEFKKIIAKLLTADDLKQYQETILNLTRFTPPQKKDDAKSWDATRTLVFSGDGSRLLVYLGYAGNSQVVVGRTGKIMILNALTGKPIPALEGVEFVQVLPGPHVFSGDGRLLALSGYNLNKGPGTGNTMWQSLPGFLTVWDTETGKVIKTWNGDAQVAFSPVRPILAVLEPNGQTKTRLGFWDFSAEAADKK